MTTVRMYYRDDDRVDLVEGERIRSVPLEAVATRVELLGYTDPADGLAACLAEMDQVEDDDSHPYDQVYDAYLPYLRRERGYRDAQGTEHSAPRSGTAGAELLSGGTSADGIGAAAESPLDAALDAARRRARTQLGAPEPGAGRSAAAVVSGAVAMGRSGPASLLAEEAASHEEVLGRLRNEPLIAELRAEFRDQLVPPREPGESM
ncbi:hypothetical protein [Nocardiopsis ganjiahuensis]|uniref:hypothetical protein n=1 Tax=Nocardiopsis ganjiahuensis TaxID=239984 RepID=UPI0004758026|nr:hypothetical protein [Nocardiopsis ganjiahuensis]